MSEVDRIAAEGMRELQRLQVRDRRRAGNGRDGSEVDRTAEVIRAGLVADKSAACIDADCGKSFAERGWREYDRAELRSRVLRWRELIGLAGHPDRVS